MAELTTRTTVADLVPGLTVRLATGPVTVRALHGSATPGYREVEVEPNGARIALMAVAEVDVLAVIAGPYGHWYAFYEGELVALPITYGEEDNPPPHPGSEGDGGWYGANDGWYAPEDLQGEERQRVLDQLNGEGN